jgi:hypothetical protein
MDRARINLDPDNRLGVGEFTLSWDLPDPSPKLPLPREYARRVGYGWRWQLEDGSAGHSWKPADCVEDAKTKAARSMEHQRCDTQKVFAEAIKDVRVVDEVGPDAKPERGA